MENLAFGVRFSRRTWAPLTFGLAGLAAYACGGAAEMEDADGLGGMGGSGIIVMPPSGGSENGTGGAPVVEKPPFETCTLAGQGTTPSGSMVIDDFDDGDYELLGNGLHGTWYQFDDATDGTQSPSWDDAGGWLPELGGLTDDGYALHVVGGGFTYWGSGQGMAPIWDEAIMQECLFDASGFDGLTFWIKGEIDGSESAAPEMDRGVVKVGFVEADIIPVEVGGRCTGESGDCYNWHKLRITPTACWRRLTIAFEDFQQDEGWGMDGGELNLDEVVNFNFEIAQGNTFDYWVDDIEFFSGEPPMFEEICDNGMGGAGGAEP